MGTAIGCYIFVALFLCILLFTEYSVAEYKNNKILQDNLIEILFWPIVFLFYLIIFFLEAIYEDHN